LDPRPRHRVCRSRGDGRPHGAGHRHVRVDPGQLSLRSSAIWPRREWHWAHTSISRLVSRGLLHYSLGWAEELARVALVWSVLLVAPFAYRSGANVAIVSFADALPPRLLLVVSVLLNLLVVWILFVLLNESFAFWRRGLDMSAATLDLKMAWFYSIVPVSFAVMVLVGIELLIRLVLRLLGTRSGIVMEGAMPAVVEN
jgi:TRAP-type C4-dicarboxylate transport system permease small subunit